MIIAAVDDLMFASKISAAARRAGVDVVFVKSLDELRSAAAGDAALLILDLNSRRTDPLATVAAIRRDDALAHLRTVGFVSHVQGDLVAAARKAGVDEVLARSAFVERLPEILSRDRAS